MSRRFVACGLLLAISAVSYADDNSKGKSPAPPANAQFDQMKKLVGTWLAADKDGKPTDEVVSVIKVTSGGSAIHETLHPGQAHEMMSVYTVDGPDLIMTHYCVLGNQPRLKANPKSPTGQIAFEFAGGGNLDPKKDKHMHEMTLTFVDADHLELNACGWENGAASKEMCHGMSLVRKK
jgi:hypothetical protein